jgi:hypothetical protein
LWDAPVPGARPDLQNGSTAVANTKVYIHEFIDIIKQNRARYMHHMTANWSPIAQEERDQLCFGVWGVVGSTGPWPAVVNMWEEDGWEGLAASFGHELGHAHLQDPKLARWWAAAADLRSGGFDRLLVPAEWSPTIEELCAEGAGGVAYAHDQIKVPAGTAADFLELARDQGGPFYEAHGWRLVGAYRTALVNDDEAFLLWSIPSWGQWGEAESAFLGGHPWRQRQREAVEDFRRILLVDAPLSPLRLGRQPARSDRDDSWSESD